MSLMPEVAEVSEVAVLPEVAAGPEAARGAVLRPATRAELPAVLALLADEERVVDPASVVVGEAYERAFAAIEADPRNELLVLVAAESGEADRAGGADRRAVVLGCLQATYIPGLGKGGAERVLIEAVRIRADRRGTGLGRVLMEGAVARARERGCALVQLTSNKERAAAHRFYEGLGFTASHDGFKRML
ncbi:GNAT family N-acetyltransferase [Streptomyces sp. NPDC097619]|uniref:GNAT family N-acetyltransferase n=1 Tax=Streptomyces sp. NPDC097619 TaxID=3157228 RepID=UPI00331AD9AF